MSKKPKKFGKKEKTYSEKIFKILSKNALMVGMNPSVSEELGQAIKKSLLKNKIMMVKDLFARP